MHTGGVDPDMVALGWALGCYSFDYFKVKPTFDL